MATAVSDTLRETLSAALRESLESADGTDSKKRRGRGALSRATRLAAGAALVAAAAPVAKRGADALRANPLELDANPLVAKATHGISGVERTVRIWTETQKLKRGASNPDAPAQESVGPVADEGSGLVEADQDEEVVEEHNGRRERTERFERQANAARGRSASSKSAGSSRKASSSSRSSGSSKSSPSRKA